MNSISANLNIMIKASEKASKILIRDFGEIEKLQVSKKSQRDFVALPETKSQDLVRQSCTEERDEEGQRPKG